MFVAFYMMFMSFLFAMFITEPQDGGGETSDYKIFFTKSQPKPICYVILQPNLFKHEHKYQIKW